MLWRGEEKIAVLWVGSDKVAAMWRGSVKIYGGGGSVTPPPEKLSCFGSGVWLPDKPWIGTDKWKPHK